MLSKKGRRMSLTYRSELIVFSKNMGPTIREAEWHTTHQSSDREGALQTSASD
jgi:hypothetical protein